MFTYAPPHSGFRENISPFVSNDSGKLRVTVTRLRCRRAVGGNCHMLTSVPRNVHCITLDDILAISPSHSGHYSLNDKPYATRSYVANDPLNARGVIHGIAVEDSDDVINANLSIYGTKHLGARRIRRTNSIFITVEGNQLRRYAFFNCGAFRVYPQYLRSKQCTHCHVIGHRADVCLSKTKYTRCPML